MSQQPRRVSRLRGSVSSVFALSLPAMFGFVSMGVDWGQVSVAQSAVRAAADEAALAAASALSGTPRTAEEIAAAQALAIARAEAYASELRVNGLAFTIDAVVVGYYDRTGGTGWSTTVPTDKGPNAVAVTASTDVDLSFAALFGVDVVAVARTSKAGASVVPGRAPDLVIVQDVTPSMSSTDITNSKAANMALVDCIESNAHPSTRGAYVKFANIDNTVMPLKSYSEAPGDLYDTVAAISPTTSYSNSGICVGGYCTSHSSGMYAAVDLLNSASEPPEGIGQAIIFITDGAPWTNNSGCSSVKSTSATATPFQRWVTGDSSNRCGLLASQTTSVGCTNVGGRWVSSGGRSPTYSCLPSDNGAEGGASAVGGACSLGSSYGSQARCEGANGVWRRSSTSTVPNPSTESQWTDQARALAEAGTWGPIDVYGVFYSSGAATTYKNDNLAYIEDHILAGDGETVGVLDAPTGSALTTALRALCEEYTVGTPGLIE